MRIVIPDDSPPVISDTPALARIQAVGETLVFTTPPGSAQDLVDRLRGAHTAVNIRGYCKFPAEVLEALSDSLKHLAIWGTGTDNVDLAAAQRLGIVVSNTPNTATDAIAEHCLALLLAVARRLGHLDAAVRRGEWPRGLLIQCRGKTLGIIGTGAIRTATKRSAWASAISPRWNRSWRRPTWCRSIYARAPIHGGCWEHGSSPA